MPVMHPLLFITQHNGVRLEEVAGALTAIAGGVVAVSAMAPGGRRGGQVLAGLCLAAAGVLAVVGLHWGHLIH
jgi:hypothetical protein